MTPKILDRNNRLSKGTTERYKLFIIRKKVHKKSERHVKPLVFCSDGSFERKNENKRIRPPLQAVVRGLETRDIMDGVIGESEK